MTDRSGYEEAVLAAVRERLPVGSVVGSRRVLFVSLGEVSGVAAVVVRLADGRGKPYEVAWELYGDESIFGDEDGQPDAPQAVASIIWCNLGEW